MKKFLRNAVIAATLWGRLLGQFLRQMPSFTGSTIIQRQVKSHSLVTASIFAMSISAILFLWMKILLILFRRMVRMYVVAKNGKLYPQNRPTQESCGAEMRGGAKALQIWHAVMGTDW